MGCDIHIESELKINNQWEHYSHRTMDRDYELFGFIAHVRTEPDEFISKPKGTPEDISIMTQFILETEKSTAHSITWLNASEIVRLEKWLEEHRDNYFPENQWGYTGNSWGGFFKYPQDRVLGIEDIRFIIWFDS